MPIHRFPDPRTADENGIVAMGGDLHPDSLRLAYRSGIFPWPISGVKEHVWFSPDPRAVLDFDRLHISASLARLKKKKPFLLTRNQAFADVLQGCARTKRKGQRGTWITDEMSEAYAELHRLGNVWSVESWEVLDGDRKKLVGGIYGVRTETYFSAESMFHLETGASKLALLELTEWLKADGLQWMDIQVLTPHLEALGAHEIPREEFLNRISTL